MNKFYIESVQVNRTFFETKCKDVEKDAENGEEYVNPIPATVLKLPGKKSLSVNLFSEGEFDESVFLKAQKEGKRVKIVIE